MPFASLRIHDIAGLPRLMDHRSPRSIVEKEPPPPPPPKYPDGGDVFLVLDLSPNFTVGHDAVAMTAGGDTFVGFRDIPPGAHLLWVSEPEAISRCGYW